MYFLKKVVDFHHIYETLANVVFVGSFLSREIFVGYLFVDPTTWWSLPWGLGLGVPRVTSQRPPRPYGLCRIVRSSMVPRGSSLVLIFAPRSDGEGWQMAGSMGWWDDGFGWWLFLVLVGWVYNMCEETNKLINKPGWLFFGWGGNRVIEMYIYIYTIYIYTCIYTYTYWTFYPLFLGWKTKRYLFPRWWENSCVFLKKPIYFWNHLKLDDFRNPKQAIFFNGLWSFWPSAPG